MYDSKMGPQGRPYNTLLYLCAGACMLRALCTCASATVSAQHAHLSSSTWVAQVALPPLRAALRHRHCPILKLKLPGSAAGTPEPERRLRPTPKQFGYASAGPSRSHSLNPLSVRIANSTNRCPEPQCHDERASRPVRVTGLSKLVKRHKFPCYCTTFRHLLDPISQGVRDLG